MWNFVQSFIGFVVYGLTALVIMMAATFWWASKDLNAPGPLREQTFFIVESGSGLRQIAGKLQDEGVIRNEFFFMGGVRLHGLQGELQAGEYLFEPGLSATGVMNKMAAGAIYRRSITLPEGLTSHEVVQRLNAFDGLPGFLVDVPPEGSLLPETYSYQRDNTKRDVIEQMKDAMMKARESLWVTRQNNLPFATQDEWIVLASLIEKETAIPHERKKIAGVFVNRLRGGIPLQTDPTVIYALTNGAHKNDGQGPLGRRLLKKDLEVDSPYNTYLYAGLPPGPIANPGYASLEAALQPETHEYLYFVADGTGGHVFAKTLEEHNSNVVKWRRIRDAQ